MNLLLDTHTFIWWADEPERLSPDALQALENENNRLFISLVSIWEMQIKFQLGKMRLPLKDLTESQEQTNDLQILSISKEHIFVLDNLPLHHKDPFDRLLIAQSIIERATLVSADSKLSDYTVELLW